MTIIELYKEIALEYHLSMKNICRISNKKYTITNIRQIEENLISVCKGAQERVAIDFLFKDTEGQSERDEIKSYRTAYLALMGISDAIKSKDDKKIKKAYESVKKIDKDFADLIKRKKSWRYLTDEEIIIMMKYRVRYAMAIDYFCKDIGISCDAVYSFDNRIRERCSSDKEYNKMYGKLLKSVEYLSDYHKAKRNLSVYKQKIKKW